MKYQNRAKCKKCGDIIISKSRHDLVSCTCGAIYIDGGNDYCRQGGNPEDFDKDYYKNYLEGTMKDKVNNVTQEDIEETIELRTMKALLAAKEAFIKCLEEAGYDPAYWDFRFTAWEVGNDFTVRLQRYEIEGEIKE